jgi:hypothetical protein
MAKVEIDIIAKDMASGTVQKVKNHFTELVAGFASGQVVATAIIGAFNKVVDVGKEMVKEFGEQEKAEAKLRTQLGQNIDSHLQFANSIQKIIAVGDDVILNAESFGRSLGITANELDDAAKKAIGFQAVLGGDLNSNMKLVAQATAGNFTMLQRYIPALKQATTDSEKMAIVNRFASEGFKQAEATGKTFTGGLELMKIQQKELLESGGKLIAQVGKDLVIAMNDNTTKLNEWIESSNAINKITFGVNITLKEIVNTYRLVYTAMFDVGMIAKESIDIFLKLTNIYGTLIEFIVNPKKALDDLKQSFIDVADAGKKAGTNLVENVKKIATDGAAEWQKYQAGYQEVMSQQKTITEEMGELNQKDLEEFIKNQLLHVEYIRMTEAEKEAAFQADKTRMAETVNFYIESFTQIGNMASSVFGSIAQLIQQTTEQGIKDRQNMSKEEKKAMLDAFNASKAASIAQVWISTAMGVAGAWMQAFSVPGQHPIASAIFAGISTALLLANAGVQTGIIASKQPGFYEGGKIMGSLGIDNIPIRVTANERVLSQKQNAMYEDWIGGTNMRSPFMYIENMTVVTPDAMDFQRQMIELQKAESAR